MSIVTQCMVVSLQVGVWQGYRHDKQATARIVEDTHADADAARVNKHLVPKSAINPVMAAAQAARRHLHHHTLPWRDNGDRLLTRDMYTKFMMTHGEHAKRFEDEVANFLSVTYPEARDRAEFRMGDMFDPTDYPSVDELRRKFYLNVDILPVSTANDFRVDIGEAEVERVKSQMETLLDERVQAAQNDVWKRLTDVLGHYATKVASGGPFQETTITKLGELVDMVPGLNLTNDPDLEAIRRRIKKQLTPFSAQDLRQDEGQREVVSQEAKDILADMAGFAKAMGG